MNRGKLAAKVKADWLEAQRRYTALVVLNDGVDEDDPPLAYFRLLLRRLAVNREYAFAFRHEEGDAPEEALRVRSDSHRLYKHLRRGISRYAEEKGLERLHGDYEMSKRVSTPLVQTIPPIFVEDNNGGLIYELREERWVMPPPELIDL